MRSPDPDILSCRELEIYSVPMYTLPLRTGLVTLSFAAKRDEEFFSCVMTSPAMAPGVSSVAAWSSLPFFLMNAWKYF